MHCYKCKFTLFWFIISSFIPLSEYLDSDMDGINDAEDNDDDNDGIDDDGKLYFIHGWLGQVNE